MMPPLMPSEFQQARESSTTCDLKSKGYSVFSGNNCFVSQEDEFNQNEMSFRGDKSCLTESEAPEFTWQFIFRPLC